MTRLFGFTPIDTYATNLLTVPRTKMVVVLVRACTYVMPTNVRSRVTLTFVNKHVKKCTVQTCGFRCKITCHTLSYWPKNKTKKPFGSGFIANLNNRFPDVSFKKTDWMIPRFSSILILFSMRHYQLIAKNIRIYIHLKTFQSDNSVLAAAKSNGPTWSLDLN